MKTCIGFDIGRSAVKIVAKAESIPQISLDFPSAICLATRISDDSSAQLAASETVSVKGVEYFVGKTALIQGRDEMIGGLTDDWLKTPQHAALLLSGLKRLKDAGVPNVDDALIVVGLPARLHASQRSSYALTISEYLPRAEIKVVPQSLGPYYTILLDSDGNSNLGVDDTSWAFIEVGQFTTDFAMVKEGRSYQLSLDSCDGMRIAAEALQRLILEKNQERIGLVEATGLLANPQLKFFGKMVDISDYVAQATAPLAQTIADKAGQLFGDQIRTLSGIRMAGGGADLILPAVCEKWSRTASGAAIPEGFVSVLPNARFAVADGFYRFANGFEVVRNQSN